jgi:hypothetical protein
MVASALVIQDRFLEVKLSEGDEYNVGRWLSIGHLPYLSMKNNVVDRHSSSARVLLDAASNKR